MASATCPLKMGLVMHLKCLPHHFHINQVLLEVLLDLWEVPRDLWEPLLDLLAVPHNLWEAPLSLECPPTP